MQETKKIKIIIGIIYLILLFIFLYLFFSKFTFEEITTYKFIQSNTEYLTNIKENIKKLDPPRAKKKTLLFFINS